MRHLKEDASTREIPVIVITADATAGQRGKLLDLGAHAYLTKPLDVTQFLGVLDEVLTDPEPTPERN